MVAPSFGRIRTGVALPQVFQNNFNFFPHYSMFNRGLQAEKIVENYFYPRRDENSS